MPTSLLAILIIVWLIVPGQFFKRFYFQGQFSSQFRSGDFADRIITSVFWGTIIQFLTIFIFSKFSEINYESIKDPLNEIFNSVTTNRLPEIAKLNIRLGIFWFYLVFPLILAILLGVISHNIIRWLELDLKYQVFRFSNKWHYYFKGDIASLDGHTSENKKGIILTTQVEVVIKDGKEKSKLFTGHLSDYFISSKTGELESIILTNAERWSDNQFKKVPGDVLMIPYTNVLDLNLTFHRLTPQSIHYSRKKKKFETLINFITSFALLFSIYFPFTLDKSFKISFIGIFFCFITSLFYISLLEMLFSFKETSESKNICKPDENIRITKYRFRDLLFAVILSVLSSIATIELLDIQLGFYSEIKNIVIDFIPF